MENQIFIEKPFKNIFKQSIQIGSQHENKKTKVLKGREESV